MYIGLMPVFLTAKRCCHTTPQEALVRKALRQREAELSALRAQLGQQAPAGAAAADDNNNSPPLSPVERGDDYSLQITFGGLGAMGSDAAPPEPTRLGASPPEHPSGATSSSRGGASSFGFDQPLAANQRNADFSSGGAAGGPPAGDGSAWRISSSDGGGGRDGESPSPITPPRSRTLQDSSSLARWNSFNAPPAERPSPIRDSWAPPPSASPPTSYPSGGPSRDATPGSPPRAPANEADVASNNLAARLAAMNAALAGVSED